MPTTYSKNAVISGEIDFYCLVCEDRLKSEEYANTHIDKAIHKKNLAQTNFAKNCAEDRIRKTKNGYYCEYCNIVMSTNLKVAMHLKDKVHLYNKTEDINVTGTSKDAKWQDNCVIFFDDLLIQEKAWNGLIDNNCAFCNVEYEDWNIHKSQSTHILKLMQSQMLIGEKKSIYRKVDEETFHCITCNEVLALPTGMHFEEDSHDERYIQCRKEMKAFNKKTKDATTANEALKPNDSDDQKAGPKNDSDSILDSWAELNKNFTSIDFLTENATCRKCNKAVELNAAKINEHIEQHKIVETEKNTATSVTSEGTSSDQADKSDSGKECHMKCDDYDAAKFANDNNILFRHNTAFCDMCKVTIAMSLAGMKEHVNGAKHTQRSAKPKVVDSIVESKIEYKTQNFNDFCTEIGAVETFSSKLIIINKRFFIDQYNFHCTRKIGGRARCNLCQKSFNHSNILRHEMDSDHKPNLVTCPVVVSEDTEFLRCLRDNVFHCGFCNLVLHNWSNVKEHLKSTDHKYEKQKHEQVKEKYLPRMRDADDDDDYEEDAIRRYLFIRLMQDLFS